MSKDLNREKAFIFRIVHRENVASMLAQGLHCRNSNQASGKYVQIGNAELIDKRQGRQVTCPPGGALNDYVPFYFTPFSPMMYNIKTGYNGITRRPSDDIAIFVSSLHRLKELGIPFVFSDRHAYLKYSRFTSDLKDLDWIDWKILQARDFKKDDVDKFERYQAEALVYKHLPVTGLLGIACYNEQRRHETQQFAEFLGVDVKVISHPAWYL